MAAVIDATDASFAEDVIQRSHEIPVVVDCWAPWCGPCRVLGPILEKLAYERDGQIQLVKVNTDENPQVAQALQVEGIPAVFAFVGGQLVNKFVGAIPEEQVRAFYDSLIPSEADIKAAEGYRMMQENQIPIARLHFESALEEDPNHEPAGVGLAAILLRMGETDRAAELARRWPNHPMSKSVFTSMELNAALNGFEADEIRRAVDQHPEDALVRYPPRVPAGRRESVDAGTRRTARVGQARQVRWGRSRQENAPRHLLNPGRRSTAGHRVPQETGSVAVLNASSPLPLGEG